MRPPELQYVGRIQTQYCTTFSHWPEDRIAGLKPQSQSLCFSKNNILFFFFIHTLLYTPFTTVDDKQCHVLPI